MARSTTTIAKNFGSGGSGMFPGAGGQSAVGKLLGEIQAAVNETGPIARLGSDAAAGTASAERLLYRSRGKGTVAAIRLLAEAAVTGHATNNATVTVRRRDADGSNAVTVLAYTTTVANALTAWVAKSVTSGLTNTALTAGQMLTVEITKGGTGVQLPGVMLEADITAAAA